MSVWQTRRRYSTDPKIKNSYKIIIRSLPQKRPSSVCYYFIVIMRNCLIRSSIVAWHICTVYLLIQFNNISTTVIIASGDEKKNHNKYPCRTKFFHMDIVFRNFLLFHLAPLSGFCVFLWCSTGRSWNHWV